jgi:hypothetical protein
MDYCFRGVVWIIQDRNRSGDCLRITLKGITLKVYRFLLLCPELDGHYATGEEIVTRPCWNNLIDVGDTSFCRCCFSEKPSCAKQGNQPCQENTWAGNDHCGKSEYQLPVFSSSQVQSNETPYQAWNSQSEEQKGMGPSFHEVPLTSSLPAYLAR